LSDHIDSPSAIEDSRLDLCDMYAFGGEVPGTTVLIFTVGFCIQALVARMK
jgi:hypothetical protein